MGKVINYLLITAAVVFMGHKVFAGTLHLQKIVKVTYEKQVELKLAGDAINRINFDNQQVMKIIGNINGYQFILSDSGTDLFITPRLPVSKKTDFSVLLGSGDIIDFSLQVVKSSKPYLVKLQFPGECQQPQKSEAVKMIEAMYADIVGKYYVQQINNKTSLASQPKIRMTAYNNYRFGDLQGNSFVLQNTDSKQTLEISLDELAKNFSGIVAVNIRDKKLAPKQKTKAFVVFKREAGA